MRVLSCYCAEPNPLQLTALVVDCTLYGDRGPRGVEKGIA